MDYLFSFVIVIAMTISLFSLEASMYSNILQQTKEIGILRCASWAAVAVAADASTTHGAACRRRSALGAARPFMYRVYVYEAFVVVFTVCDARRGLTWGCDVCCRVCVRRA